MVQGMWQNSPTALHVCQRCCGPWKRRTLGLNASGSVGATWAEAEGVVMAPAGAAGAALPGSGARGSGRWKRGAGHLPPGGPNRQGAGRGADASPWLPGPGVKGRDNGSICGRGGTRAPGSTRGVCRPAGGAHPEGPAWAPLLPQGPPEVPTAEEEGLCPGRVGRRGPARGHRGRPSCALGGVLRSRRPGHKACARAFTRGR